MELNNQTEQRILEAAEHVFYSKGKEGASMQEIADKAGITRTSLNYYYRSKDKLFEVIFRNTMSQFVPKLAELMETSDALSEYFPKMVQIIIDTMIERPQIPVFVMAELTSNPGRMPLLMAELGIHPEEVLKNLKGDERLSKLTIDPRQFMINLLAMCIFPFAAKPMIVSALYQGNEAAFIAAMKQRKVLIPQMIEAMLKNFES